MGTEFVVYGQYNLFKEMYSQNYNDVNFNQKIVDFYYWKEPAETGGKEHLIVLTDYLKDAGRPEFSKTVIFLHGDDKYNLVEMLDGENKLIEWNQVVRKGDRIEFGSKGTVFKKPLLSFPCTYRSRHPFKAKRAEQYTWLYDYTRDRINLLDESLSPTLTE